MTRNDSEAEDRYLEFQLDGKQVIIVLAGILLLCAVSFHFGRRIGRAEAAAVRGEVSALMGQPTGGEALSDEDAGTDLTFFDTLGETGGSAPPPVASGTEADSGGSARAEEREPVAPAPAAPPAAAPEPSRTPAAPPAAPAASAPASGRFDLQVAAYSDRSRAEALASRLGQKGYSARVVAEATGGRSLYKVRVGSFSSRAEADATKARLEREEKLQPWVVAAGG